MKRSLFKMPHEVKLSCNMGELVPISLMEAVPGDVFKHHTSLLVRTQPLLAPVMHKVDASIHHWFVPFRLIWEDWEDFRTGGLDGTQAPTFPTITFATGPGPGTLANFLGVPAKITGFDTDGIEVSALPFRAYSLICNSWYFDQQLDTMLTIDLTSGADTTTNTTLQHGRWQKDYFTAARPEPQLGTEVTIPLTGNAPVLGLGKETQTFGLTNQNVYETDGSGTTNYASSTVITDTGANQRVQLEEDPNNPGFPGVFADLSNVSAVDINELRLASMIQRFKERCNRTGARYVEWAQSFFGTRPQDSRLQLPEYLGGGTATIQFSEVLATAETGTSVDVGDMKGHGIAAGRSNRYKYFCPEDGFIISMLCVRPKTDYFTGLHRLWNRRSNMDFLIPDFASLGDQAVLQKEIYAASATPNATWGYSPRFDEYRYMPNRVAGEFVDVLDYWHMARRFASDPALNSDFVKCVPTTDVFAATNADQLYVRAIHDVKVKRPLPKVAVPSLR